MSLLLITRRNTTYDAFADACRTVAEHCYDARGVWIYQAFDWINETLFFGELPTPLIVIGLTAHGACLGWTRSEAQLDRAPVVMLHPSLWRAAGKKDPWGFRKDLLGPRFAFDTLIHECIHVSVHYRLGGPTVRSKGDKSHNNPEWIAEVNRIAPLIGLPGIRAAMSRPKREGKKIKRHTDGNIPFDAAAKFPREVRHVLGKMDYYRDRTPLPFETTCNAQLGVTA